MTKTPPLQRFRNWCRRTNNTDTTSQPGESKLDKKSSSKLKQVSSSCSEGTTLSIKARSGGDVLKRGASFKVSLPAALGLANMRRGPRLSCRSVYSGVAE